MKPHRRTLVAMCVVLLYVLMENVHANPNHLEPISPFDLVGTGYDQAVFASLVGKGWAYLWMIEKPSSYREYAIILRCKTRSDLNEACPAPRAEAEPEQWYIEYAVPKKKIWPGIRISPSGELLPVAPTEDVAKHFVPITKDFAQILQQAWSSALELTRYAKPVVRKPDGTRLQFYCGGRFGETSSPSTGVPAMLADLGRELRALALADDGTRSLLLAEAETLAARIVQEAEAERTRVFGNATKGD